MRIKRSPTVLVMAALWLASCASDPPPDEPPLQASPIYEVTPTGCRQWCWSLTLHRSKSFIELRAHDLRDSAFLGLATGSLTEPASEELDQLLDEAAANLGEYPGASSHDGAFVGLWLEGLYLHYMNGYPPSGLVELDAFLATVLDDMSQCRATTQITPDDDCEPLAWFPE